MMNTLKQKHYDNAMRTVLEHCPDFDNYWAGETLTTFCNNSNNKNALRVLANKNYIKLITTDNGGILGIVILENGLNYFSDKSEKNKEFIKNFFSQFLSGFFSGVLVAVIGELLIKHFVK